MSDHAEDVKCPNRPKSMPEAEAFAIGKKIAEDDWQKRAFKFLEKHVEGLEL